MMLTENRPAMLRDATVAYYYLVQAEPGNEEALMSLMELYRTRRAWGDLEYYATFFLERHPEYERLKYYRALALDQMNRWDDAVSAYRELAEAGHVGGRRVRQFGPVASRRRASGPSGCRAR